MTDATTYYIIDSMAIVRAKEDSLLDKELYSFSRDTSFYFTKDKWITSSVKSDKLQNGHEGTIRPFTLEGDDGIFAILLVCFALFSHIYRGGFSFFKENIRLLFSFRNNVNIFSETTTTEFWFNFVLIFQSILLSSIVMFDTILELENYTVPIRSLNTILLFTLAITLFLVLKYLFYRFLGHLFDVQSSVDIWLRNYMLVLEMMGIVGFIPTLMLVYSLGFHQYLLIFFLLFFLFSRVILFYRIITFFLRENVNLLFLIAYLCSVEVIPYFIMYQTLIYLYNLDIIEWLWH